MSFFRRLFGLETPDEKLQRKLQEQKNKVIKILSNDGRVNKELLAQIEAELFTPESIISMISDVLQTQALNETAQQALQETKQETSEIIAELDVSNVDGDTVDIIQATDEESVPESMTNASLLSELTDNLTNMIIEISENNKRIANMEQRLRILKQDTADINQVISELRIKMDNTEDLEEKERLIIQIQDLEQTKKQMDASAQNIKRQIGEIQRLVAEQSSQLANFQQGSGKDNYFKKVNKMTRKELDDTAKRLNLTPSQYKKKKDIQDAIKLMSVAKKLPLNKMDKQRLSVISQNYGITSKSKKGMLEGLKKYKLIK